MHDLIPSLYKSTCTCIHAASVPLECSETKNVTESEEMVEVCIVTDSLLARSIIVTAVTGNKSGATEQATGNVIAEN